MERFSKDGKLIIPLPQRKDGTRRKDAENVRYAVTEAYCPDGCSIIDKKHEIHGIPGLRIGCRRLGIEGQFVLSAIEGDSDKIILSGELQDRVRYELHCPHCGAMFKKLVNCSCRPDADMVTVGLTPKLDFNNAITFCNVAGCTNSTLVKSGEVLRHMRLLGTM